VNVALKWKTIIHASQNLLYVAAEIFNTRVIKQRFIVANIFKVSVLCYIQINRAILGMNAFYHFELKMGHTPTREAIRRLCEDGLLYQRPQSGTYVTQPDRQSLVEVYEVRLALESFAARQAAGKITADEIKTLRACIKRTAGTAKSLANLKMKTLDESLTREFLEADIIFHSTILNVAGNVSLMRLVTAGQIRNRVFGMSSHLRDRDHVMRVVDIHTKIVDALEAGDGRQTAENMETHMRQSMTEALDAFDRSARAENPSCGGLAKTAMELQNMLFNIKSEK